MFLNNGCHFKQHDSGHILLMINIIAEDLSILNFALCKR
jgi:hypothetical protein